MYPANYNLVMTDRKQAHWSDLKRTVKECGLSVEKYKAESGTG